MTNSTKEITRRNLRLDIPAVTKLLPEYFAGEFGVDSGSLTKLLELYYEYLDSDGIHSFHKEVSNIFELRDPAQNETKYLDEIIKEIGNGLTSSSFFQNPRLMAKLLPLFYKSKGSKVATEGFFRGFFGEEATIEFPKDNLLFVGGLDPSGTQGRIGFDFQNRLPNNAQFQIFSILIKSGLSVSDYESLYTRFAHPAGFNFSGQVAFDGEGVITLTSEGINPIESSVGDILLVDEATQTITTGFAQLTAIFDSSANGDPATDGVFRVSLSVVDTVERYKDITISRLSEYYSSAEQLASPNSFTLDNNRRRRVFDVASDDIAFSNTNGQLGGTGDSATNPTLRLVGTIAEWNAADSNFEAYSSGAFSSPTTGTMSVTSSDGYIDSNEIIMVTASNNVIATDSGENYERQYTTKFPVDLSGVTRIIYWTNKGDPSAWGNNPAGNEDLILSFGKTLGADNTISGGSILNTHDVTDTANTWNKHTLTITNIADSSVHLEFSQKGNQFGDSKDNWAFTSIYVDSSYDSVGPDMSLGTETMDNDMFTRYLSDSAI